MGQKTAPSLPLQGLLAAVCFLALSAPDLAAAPGAVVAADGSGQYTKILEAINAAPQNTSAADPWVISVKPGTYKELIYIQREKRFIHLVGEDPEKTVITFDVSPKQLGPDAQPLGTFRTATLVLDADDFTVENLTIENTAGKVGPALALRCDGDRVTFRNCRFSGWQDTLLLNRGRQYFEHCRIAGATDFIFGGATAFFEDCQIHCLGSGYITAASTPDFEPFGFVFSHCRITGETPDLKTYLGRPWRAYASTIFLYTEMSEVIRPEGWQNWGKPEREKTARYTEYGSTGPGAQSAKRVTWTRPLSDDAAKTITPQKVLSGVDEWNPKTGSTRILNNTDKSLTPSN